MVQQGVAHEQNLIRGQPVTLEDEVYLLFLREAHSVPETAVEEPVKFGLPGVFRYDRILRAATDEPSDVPVLELFQNRDHLTEHRMLQKALSLPLLKCAHHLPVSGMPRKHPLDLRPEVHPGRLPIPPAGIFRRYLVVRGHQPHCQLR